jgi:hypothetical protein
VTARDMVIFNTAFFGDDPVADFDGDGQVNELDYSLFVNSYLDGCEPIESSDNE